MRWFFDWLMNRFGDGTDSVPVVADTGEDSSDTPGSVETLRPFGWLSASQEEDELGEPQITGEELDELLDDAKRRQTPDMSVHLTFDKQDYVRSEDNDAP